MARLLLADIYSRFQQAHRVSKAAAKHKLLPANDADYAKVADTSDDQQAQVEGDQPARLTTSAKPVDSPEENRVKTVIEKFRAFVDEMDDLKEVLRAHGVPLRTTQMMVEFGVQNQLDKQTLVMDSAMEQAEKTYGEGALKRQELEEHISVIVNLERDLTDARTAAREEGLDVKALSILTQMVQQNPGDEGAKAVNTFLGYALAFGVKTDQLSEIAGGLTQRKVSVLPSIAGKTKTAQVRPWVKLAQDMLVGFAIGVVIISMLL